MILLTLPKIFKLNIRLRIIICLVIVWELNFELDLIPILILLHSWQSTTLRIDSGLIPKWRNWRESAICFKMENGRNVLWFISKNENALSFRYLMPLISHIDTLYQLVLGIWLKSTLKPPRIGILSLFQFVNHKFEHFWDLCSIDLYSRRNNMCFSFPKITLKNHIVHLFVPYFCKIQNVFTKPVFLFEAKRVNEWKWRNFILVKNWISEKDNLSEVPVKVRCFFRGFIFIGVNSKNHLYFSIQVEEIVKSLNNHIQNGESIQRF